MKQKAAAAASKQVVKMGSYGSGATGINSPVCCAFSADGSHLFVTDQLNNRIKIMCCKGGPVESFGSVGRGDGEFMLPSGISTALGLVFVADTNNNRVSVWTTSRKFCCSFGERGDAVGKFSSPRGISTVVRGVGGTVGSKVLIAVTDYNNDRVVLLAGCEDGSSIQILSKDVKSSVIDCKAHSFRRPVDVCFVGSGSPSQRSMANLRLCVCGDSSEQICVFSHQSGALLQRAGLVPFTHPEALQVR
jgi:hypothetical protein